MKIRAIILSALILCGISAVIMYSRAAQPQQKSSVITQAINDKNTPMVIKNLILKMKEQMEVNDDQFPELIKEVENYTNSCADSASVAVLHSMLAEMYQNYFQRNQWTINQRTQLSGYIPEDIRDQGRDRFIIATYGFIAKYACQQVQGYSGDRKGLANPASDPL